MDRAATTTEPLTAARRRLADRWAGLPAFVLRTRHRGLVAAIGWDDALGHAGVFLCEAARRFRPGRGVRFNTYAVTCLDLRLRSLYGEVCGTRRRSRSPDAPLPAVADVLGVEPAALAGRDAGDGPGRHPAAWDALARALAPLPPRLRRAVELRYGLLDGRERTLAACGAELGVSKERVRQMLAEAVGWCRDAAGRAGG